MTDRELILSRVRAALNKPASDTHARFGPPPPPPADDSLARLASPGIDLLARFIESVNRTGMRASRTGERELPGAFDAILRAESPRAVLVNVASPALAPAQLAAHAACQSLGITTATEPSARAFDADLAIIDATAAVAETGSMLLSSDDRRRCAWIVPPKLLVLVPSRVIVPDLLDLWSSPASPVVAFEHAPPAAMLLVSGPSKTADIEGVLVTGVHGPGVVHVLLIESDRAG